MDSPFLRGGRRRLNLCRPGVALGIPLHVLLPLPPSEFRTDFSAADWAGAGELIARAEHVRVIAENGSREDAYLDCGMETVNESDVLLVLWDGEPARGKGGTADVIAYARELGKPLVLIDSATLDVRRENFERFSAVDHNLADFNRLPDAPRGAGQSEAAPANWRQ